MKLTCYSKYMPQISPRNSEKGPASTRRQGEAGQILLIVVLASVISLTVGLAAISRSVTNTRISTEEANSQKALAAAEAGVEEQLNRANLANTAAITDRQLSNKSEFDATVDSVDGTQVPINNGLPISQDDGADIWLSDYPSFTNPRSPNLTIMWNAPTGSDPCVAPAMEVAVIYGADRNNPSMGRYAADPCSSRRSDNRFTNAGGSSSITYGGKTYNFQFTYNIGLINSGYIARVIPLYANAGSMGVRVNNGVGLPPQGFVIDSTGSAGNAVRKVKVFQGYPRVPVEFFPYNLFLP